MGFVPGPQALTKEQFDKRVAKLKQQGLPLTMENIDPEYTGFHNEQMRFYGIAEVVLALGLVLFISLIFKVL